MNYLIYSSSYRLANEEVEKIINGNKNINKHDLAFDDLANIIEEAAYFSLFDEKKVVLVKNSLCFNKTKEKYQEDNLLSYLKDSNPNTTLIFITSNPIDQSKEITKYMKNNHHYIDIKTPSYKDIEAKIKKLFSKKGFTISPQDISYIVNASLKNYDLSVNNAEKIMLYYDKPQKISHEDVINLTSNTLEEKSFRFIEAVTDKNIKDALKILDDLIKYKEDLILLNATLIGEFKNIIKAVAYKKSSYTNKEIESFLGKKDWQITKYLNKANKYRKNELEGILKNLLELDYNLKRGLIKPEIGLQLFLLNM